MKYVIVSDVRGQAGEMNNKLRKEVREVLGVKSSTLPAHFTIKSPFEMDQPLEELKSQLRVFAQAEVAYPYQLQGYNHFDRYVVYMDVKMSQEAKAAHDRLIDVLATIPYMKLDWKDGKDKTFHVTVSSKKVAPIYETLWAYVQQYPCDFACMFDNVSLYRWEETMWVLEEAFELRVRIQGNGELKV